VIRLRAFRSDDAAAVAALHARLYPEGGWASQAARASYFREVLLHNPWYEPDMPSWVAHDGDRIAGFFGVLPRRMVYGGREIRVAVACQFMVDPDRRRGFTALELLRRYLSGPQQLSVADGANDSTRVLWEAAGGLSSALHGLHWVRVLRPARALWHRASSRHGLRVLAPLGAPAASLLDACMRPFAPARPDATLRESELGPDALLAALQAHGLAFALRPHYTLAELQWLLTQVKAKRRHGELQTCLLRDAGGRTAGWFLYYLNRATSQVIQVAARRDDLPAVMGALFHHAWRRGAAALEGRMEPALANVVENTRCRLVSRGIRTLLHARDPELLLALLRGDAFFSRLEGEWWMRFPGEPPGAVAPAP
jgi:hypothetical protein